MKAHLRRLAGVLVALALLAVACSGGSGDESSSGSDAPPVGDDSSVTTSDGPQAILTSDDIEQVCRGTGQPAASSPDEGPAPHIIVTFEGEDPSYSYRSLTLPDDWTSFLDYEATQMVVCLNRVAATPVENCGPYESDGTEWMVQTFDSTHEVTVRDARTGEVLASTTLESTADGCPFVSSYSEGDPNPVPEYAIDTDQLEAFLAPLVTGS